MNTALRRTKIIATLGPASRDEETLAALFNAGVNVVRLNFSHGTHEQHGEHMATVRRVALRDNHVIGILADLQGPKIRISSFKEGEVMLQAGQAFAFDASLPAGAGDEQVVGIDYKALPNDVAAGDRLLLDDGRVAMRVDSVDGDKIYCTVDVGGRLSDHKGINREGGGLSAEALTEKDKKDLAFAISNDVDFVAISFPRSAEDVIQTKRLIASHHGCAAVIAKIERKEALDCLEGIITVSDGVMVARGDLGVEIGDARVPVVQREIIHMARRLDKPVITATQMMESMITATIPTRAEVSDVATAALENTDAVMLSAETATGDHPVLVVEAMARACEAADNDNKAQISGHRMECEFGRIDEAIAMATMYTANHYNVKAIVALTESGATPLWMSRIRTAIPIYGLSRNVHTLRKMTLYRGVYPVPFDATTYVRDEVNQKAVDSLEVAGALSRGEQVILTKGDHMGVGGGANSMKLLIVGQVL